MGKTITTHNGSAANRDHNIRNPKATEKQEHIDKELSKNNEMLVDEKPRDAYKRIFGAALNEYNAKQNRPERRIKDYYNHIEADQKKHAVYEMIVQVGDKDDTGLDAPTERAVIKEFIAGWPERNPNLELIGAYIHADEHEGTLHAHLDYVPVAHGYRNGLHTQNGLVKALGEQGFNTNKNEKITAQIRWEARENKTLEEICNRHGIEVDRPSTGRKHLDTPEYKEYAAELEAIKGKIEAEKEEYRELQELVNDERLTLDELIGVSNDISSGICEQRFELKEIQGKINERLQEAEQEAKKIIESGKSIVADNVGKSHEHLEETKKECSEMLLKAQIKAQAVKDNIIPIKAEYDAYKAFIGQSIKDSDISMMYPDYVKTNKSLLGKETVTVPKDKWEARHVAANQINAIEQSREALERAIRNFKNLVPAKKIKELENEITRLQLEFKRLRQQLDKAADNIDRVNKVFEKRPDIKNAFYDAEKTIDAEKNVKVAKIKKKSDMER